MASQFNFRCAQDTVAGVDLVLTIDETSRPSQLQVVCVSGTIEVEGETGTILGQPVSKITYLTGQAINLNEISYKNITITIKVGTEYQLIANE